MMLIDATYMVSCFFINGICMVEVEMSTFLIYFILLWPLSKWQHVEFSLIFHYHHWSHQLHNVVVMTTLLLMTINKLTLCKSHKQVICQLFLSRLFVHSCAKDIHKWLKTHCNLIFLISIYLQVWSTLY